MWVETRELQNTKNGQHHESCFDNAYNICQRIQCVHKHILGSANMPRTEATRPANCQINILLVISDYILFGNLWKHFRQESEACTIFYDQIIIK